MPAALVLAAASAGKTQHCIGRVRELLRAEPLAEVWVVLPNRLQAVAFRRRLAEAGGALGAHVGTFGDVYAELLARAGRTLPEAGEPVVLRLIQAAIETLADRGDLLHYSAIRDRPGFPRALGRLIAELKRARIEPPHFAAAVRGRARPERSTLGRAEPVAGSAKRLTCACGWGGARAPWRWSTQAHAWRHLGPRSPRPPPIILILSLCRCPPHQQQAVAMFVAIPVRGWITPPWDGPASRGGVPWEP